MYQILDYKKRAINMLIPYLLEFPQIVSIVEQGADRYQEIEKVLWELVGNLSIDNSRGYFLQQKVDNSVTNIIYTDVAPDAFQYGSDNPELQGYGAGHYYSQANYVSGTNLSVSDAKLIRGIKSKIIRNNFDGTIESFIGAMKLLFNAESVEISESYPLAVTLLLKGSKLEISTSGTYDSIKALLAGGVKLQNVYLDNNTFPVLRYDNVNAYGVARYPILASDTVDVIPFFGKCIRFTSENKMYCKSDTPMYEDKVLIATGRLYKDIETRCTIFSSNNGTSSLSIFIDNENKANLEIDGNIVTYSEPLLVDTDYTFVYSKNRLWVLTGCKLAGEHEADSYTIHNIVSNSEPSIMYEGNLPTVDSFIYINALVNPDGTLDDAGYGDFIYYAMISGQDNTDTFDFSKYYVTAYGETKVLFNVVENANHLEIQSLNPILKNFYDKQSSFNYEKSHNLERYMFMESGDSVVYHTASGEVDNINISMDLFIPFLDQDMQVFKIYNEDNTQVFLSIDVLQDGILAISILSSLEQDDGSEILTLNSLATKSNYISVNKYYNIDVNINSGVLNVYVNNESIITDFDTKIDVSSIGNTVTFGETYHGIIRNASIITDLYNLELPFTKVLNNPVYSHINSGAKFITAPSNMLNQNIIIAKK